MKKRNFIISGILALCLAFGGLVTVCSAEEQNLPIEDAGMADVQTESDCPSAKYTDLDTARWYHESVDYALSKGYFQGVEEKLFDPDGTMTRAMFVTVLSRMEGISAEDYTGSDFTDVPENKWYSAAVKWASENKIVTGVGDHLFDPNGDVSREQMSVIMHRYAQRGVDVSVENKSKYDSFSDVEQVSDWAEEGMTWAVDKGLLNGTDVGLEPKSNATRVQVAAVLERFGKKILADMEVYEGDVGGGVRYSLNGQTGLMKLYWTGKGSGVTKGYYYSVGYVDGFTSEETPSFDSLTDQIREIKIEEGVKGLECFLFKKCDRVEKISIPASLTDIRIIPESPYGYGIVPTESMSYESFISQNKLKEISVAEGNPSYCSVDGVLYNKDQTELVQYPGGSERDTYTVPDGVTKIQTAAIKDASHLKHLILPESVTDFERIADCSQLEDIEMPSRLNSGKLTIYHCESLENLMVPEGVSAVYASQSRIKSLTLSSTVSDLNFRNLKTPELQNVFISGENSIWSSVDGILFSRDKKTLIYYPQGRTGEYTIPDGISELGDCAFCGSALTSCTIPDSVKTIGDYTFSESSLTSCVIPEGVEKLGDYAFEKCTKLESLTVPKSVTSSLVGNHILGSCGSVFRYLYLGGTEEHWKNRLWGYFPENTQIVYLND